MRSAEKRATGTSSKGRGLRRNDRLKWGSRTRRRREKKKKKKGGKREQERGGEYRISLFTIGWLSRKVVDEDPVLPLVATARYCFRPSVKNIDNGYGAGIGLDYRPESLNTLASPNPLYSADCDERSWRRPMPEHPNDGEAE